MVSKYQLILAIRVPRYKEILCSSEVIAPQNDGPPRSESLMSIHLWPILAYPLQYFCSNVSQY